jgi:hypothetical protein
MERALKAFQHAVDIDPTFTDALVAMAGWY